MACWANIAKKGEEKKQMLSFFSPSFGYVNAMLIKKKKKKSVPLSRT